MKKLILFLGVLFSVSSSFAEVRVVIDGKNFNCSEGGGSTGNKCECVVESHGGGWRYIYYKNGVELKEHGIFSGSNGEDKARAYCQKATIADQRCYQ